MRVVLETSIAIGEFQLDPRARPPFDTVFFYQYCLTTTISVELFLRILHLVVTFSVLNSVKSKFLKPGNKKSLIIFKRPSFWSNIYWHISMAGYFSWYRLQ